VRARSEAQDEEEERDSINAHALAGMRVLVAVLCLSVVVF
jgi:hypothetical protein